MRAIESSECPLGIEMSVTSPEAHPHWDQSHGVGFDWYSSDM